MAKIAQKYLEVHPWKLIEKTFRPGRSRVSESVFSLGNEYMGVRGTFDEGISLPTLRGTYFNGVYEYAKEDTPNAYRGIVKRTHFMINSVDFYKIKLDINGQTLDLAQAKVEEFYRELDFKTGVYTRSFVWMIEEIRVSLHFERFLSMVDCHQAYQKITLSSQVPVTANLTFSLDSHVLHWGKDCYYKTVKNVVAEGLYTLNETLTTKQKVLSLMHIDAPYIGTNSLLPMGVTCSYQFQLDPTPVAFTRYIVNLIDKEGSRSVDEMIRLGQDELHQSVERGYEEAKAKNRVYWANVWATSDIEIDGDPINQQGIRFTIFQLEQTYHGFDPHHNIGAKGLTGEAYSGHAFWDSETYCLPYYLFNNAQAAKDLLLFRYYTLPQAKARAKMLDCTGACYPIATLNGEEGCNLWQHASLQFQPSTAVAYGLYHYEKVTGDKAFVLKYGLEMLLEISRFLLARGQWNQTRIYFGFYGVMGPDEFQMMVNHNTYTNLLAKKTFDYTLKLINENRQHEDTIAALAKTQVNQTELDQFALASEKMLILYDEHTKLFEQHLGFYDLPHIDPEAIPVEEFPLYSHWTYDRIYRNDLIKQPDVLMFMFLYNTEYSIEQKRANYDYYEPKTIHESSLSPSIHSIFASELGYDKAAMDFFSFATRMDLDDYNRNSNEGLHTTSIAAAWMNIVYGFGGLRSDGEMLVLKPTLPSYWQSYSFKITYRNAHIKVAVFKDNVTIRNLSKTPITLQIYNKQVMIENHYSVER